MANVNGKLAAPLGVRELCSTLGESTYNLGQLCVSPKINIWSERKPVRMALVRALTDAEWRQKNCGFVVSSGTTVYDTAAMCIDGFGWVYERPRGGESEPFRKSDLVGYEHLAQPWFSLAEDFNGKEMVNLTGVGAVQTLADKMNAFSFLSSGQATSNAYMAVILLQKSSTGAVSHAMLYIVAAYEDFFNDPDKMFKISHATVRNGYGSGDWLAVAAIVRPTATPTPLPKIYVGTPANKVSVGQIYPLPGNMLPIHIRTAAESQYNPSELGITVTLLSGSYTHGYDNSTGYYVYNYTFKLKITSVALRDIAIDVTDSRSVGVAPSFRKSVVAGGTETFTATGKLQAPVAPKDDDSGLSVQYNMKVYQGAGNIILNETNSVSIEQSN